MHTRQSAGHVLGVEINQGGVWVWKQEKNVGVTPLEAPKTEESTLHLSI